MGTAVVESDQKLHISVLGPIDVRLEGIRIGPMRSRKEQWLIALLILRNDRFVTREWLAEALWPDNSLTQSLAYLRRAVYLLRQMLKSEAFRLCGEGSRTLRFIQAGAYIDLVEFDAALKRGGPDDLRLAVELYRGHLLEGCDEEWLQGDRQVRELGYVNALERLAEHERVVGNLTSEIHCLRRLIKQDPLRESAHRAIMQAFADDGDLSAMITAYRDLRLMLRRELNADPDPSTTALYEFLRNEPRSAVTRGAPRPPTQIVTEKLAQASASSDSSSVRPAQAARRPLPRPLTRLIGRDQEIHEAASALNSSRLVTLTGAGGVGKTRLALFVAASLENTFRDGVCYVDISGLTHSDLVAQSIAMSLGHANIADPSVVNTVSEYLEDKKLLLVLDGCEHLIQAAASVADMLLKACPDVKILATSQQPVGINGEAVLRTPTLLLPPISSDRADHLTAERAIHYAAVRLFVERAVVRRPDFTLHDSNVGAIVQICYRLDGIPLAIELAAARLTVLSVDQIASKLDDRFRLLTTGSRTAVPRQQTLRAALDWSYDLLDRPEQRLLQRLSAFAGGSTLEAIESLCADDPDLTYRVLDLLQQLIDKSFVWSAPPGASNRYRLLETTREYLVEKLRDSGDLDTVKHRHSLVYQELIKTAAAQIKGPNPKPGWDWIDAEADNIRTILDWMLRDTSSSEEVRSCQLMITTQLVPLWRGRAHLGEARHWVEHALARDETQSIERAHLLKTAGYLDSKQGAFAPARANYENSMAIFTSLNNDIGILSSLNSLGMLALNTGNYNEARELLGKCLTGFQNIGDGHGARSASNNLGIAAMMAGDYVAARSYHEFCLEYAIREDNLTAAGWCLDNLAEVCQAEGDLINAMRLFKDSLQEFVRADYHPGIADCIQGLAEVACVGPDDIDGARASARLLGAADHMREVSGLALLPVDITIKERTIEMAKLAAGEQAFTEEWSAGREMSDEEAIAYGMSLPAAPAKAQE